MDPYAILFAQYMIDQRTQRTHEARHQALARQVRPVGGPPGRLKTLLGAWRRRRPCTASSPTSRPPRDTHVAPPSGACTSTCSTP